MRVVTLRMAVVHQQWCNVSDKSSNTTLKNRSRKKKKLKQQQRETEQSIQMSEHLFEPIKFSVKRNIVSV